ncbi:late promoter transcription accessory protein [uncultured Planktosalinus sp.]|uniref:late promoter transcription accessory protein n=1 Tax=uncultured Planktosalinus sp. TaxID=1810935 RepID=UPI0030D7EA27
MIEKILTKENFCVLVEESVRKKAHPYMDAVLEICDKHTIDPEQVSSLLNMSIKDKIEAEARDLNYLEKVNKLPL